MPRPLRITVSNLPSHILGWDNNRQIILHEDEGLIYFLKLTEIQALSFLLDAKPYSFF